MFLLILHILIKGMDPLRKNYFWLLVSRNLLFGMMRCSNKEIVVYLGMKESDFWFFFSFLSSFLFRLCFRDSLVKVKGLCILLFIGVFLIKTLFLIKSKDFFRELCKNVKKFVYFGYLIILKGRKTFPFIIQTKKWIKKQKKEC